ncbi:MAG: flavodoxin family protein [Actinomycetota bacterium]
MEKKIVAIYGSPRREGNTAALMDSFLQGAGSNPYVKNLSVDRIMVSRQDISPCRGCRSCTKTGECIIEDQMQQIYPRLIDADFIAVATPIFFTTVSGYLKALIDRCQRLWSLKYEHKKKVVVKKRSGILIACAGSKYPEIFDCARKVIRSFFDVLYVGYHTDYVYNQVDEKKDIEKVPGALKRVFEFGKSEEFSNLLEAGE